MTATLSATALAGLLLALVLSPTRSRGNAATAVREQ